MKKPNRYSFLPLLLIPLCLFGYSNPQMYFRNYSTEQGLPSPEVYTAFQDSKGYMWFGTDNGATSFDGYSFKNFGAKEGLTSNVVFNIFEDEASKVWFGTMTGEVFRLEGDSILPYLYNDIILQYMESTDHVHTSYSKQEKRFYFELRSRGILYINQDGSHGMVISENPISNLIYDNQDHNQLLCTTVDIREDPRADSLAAVQQQKGTIELKIQTNSHVVRTELPTVRPTIYDIQGTRLQIGDLLFYGYGYLYYFSKGQLIWLRKFHQKINKIVQGESGDIWICLGNGKGLMHFKGLTALFKNKSKVFLTGLSISNIFFDKADGIWISSQEQGVFYLNNPNINVYNKEFGLSQDFVSTLAFKGEEEIYVGNRNGEIAKINISSNTFLERTKNPFGYHNYDLIYTDKFDILWSSGSYWKDGSWGFVSPKKARKVSKAPLDPQILNKIQIGEDGYLLGCNSMGMYTIDLNNLKVKDKPPISSRYRALGFLYDRLDTLWIGKLDGLYKSVEGLQQAVDLPHPAFKTRVEDIDQLSNNHLVFGTKGWGTVIWDRKQDFIILTEEEGLTSNMIEDVHVDENGILWIGTLNGLNKVTFNESEEPIIRQFTMAHGLPSNEIYKIKSHKGQVWLCTAGGLVRFQETDVEAEATPPILQAIEVNGRSTTRKNLSQLSYRNNNFVFQYLTINYKQNGNIQYRFRLHENDDWSYTKNRTANYPALPPDQYRFEVQSKNEDGLWSNSTIQYFTITPPWWATSWFIILVSLSFITSSFGIFQYRLQQLRKRSLIQQQISKLEKSALQAQMNPHFIFNCLNSIQNFILQHNSQKAVDFLSRFARLVRLHLNASMDGYISLEEEISLLDNYLILEQERFDHKFQFQLELDPSIEADQIQIPPLLIQPFVENAIVHGMANKRENGRIQIKFLKKDEHLQVTIRDNGNNKVALNNKRKSHDYKSVGMSITQKRLQLMDQSQTEVLEITSIQDQDPQLEGTLVTILIKYQSL